MQLDEPLSNGVQSRNCNLVYLPLSLYALSLADFVVLFEWIADMAVNGFNYDVRVSSRF